MTSRTISIFALLAVLSAVTAFADDAALRGKMAMSAYVSVSGDNEVNGAELRLSLEQQLHKLGITVLTHGDPPNYPVLNLKIDAKSEMRTIISRNIKGEEISRLDRLEVTYSSAIELRQPAPGTTPATRPIQDVEIWSLSSEPKTIVAIDAWVVGDEAMQLAMEFAKAWRRANGAHAPTVDKPQPPVPPCTANADSRPPLRRPEKSSSCQEPVGGGCLDSISLSGIGLTSVSDVADSQQDMVRKQLEDVNAAGHKVLTCEYGPSDPQAGTGFFVYHFWYQSVPPNILDLLTSAYGHPLMELGRVAVTACPCTKEQADAVKGSRFE